MLESSFCTIYHSKLFCGVYLIWISESLKLNSHDYIFRGHYIQLLVVKIHKSVKKLTTRKFESISIKQLYCLAKIYTNGGNCLAFY